MKQMEELEGELAELFQKVKPKSNELNQAISLVENRRSDLVNLILGPSFFGDEEFFKSYKVIHRHGTGRQIYGWTKYDAYKSFDRTYFFNEGEKEQILLRVNYELFNKGHYHTALVRHSNDGNIGVYEAPVPIGHLGVPNPSYRNGWLNRNWITEHMTHYPVEELVKYEPNDKHQMMYHSFSRAITGATKLLLDTLSQEKETAEKLIQITERNIVKLQAVANIESK